MQRETGLKISKEKREKRKIKRRKHHWTLPGVIIWARVSCHWFLISADTGWHFTAICPVKCQYGLSSKPLTENKPWTAEGRQKRRMRTQVLKGEIIFSPLFPWVTCNLISFLVITEKNLLTSSMAGSPTIGATSRVLHNSQVYSTYLDHLHEVKPKERATEMSVSVLSTVKTASAGKQS